MKMWNKDGKGKKKNHTNVTTGLKKIQSECNQGEQICGIYCNQRG